MKSDDMGGSCVMNCLTGDMSKKFKPGHRRSWGIILRQIIQSEGVNIRTDAICLVASCCEHGNEH
jgi:hypothetical protein